MTDDLVIICNVPFGIDYRDPERLNGLPQVTIARQIHKTE